LKVDFKLAALGALAFGFSTYLIIILGVGHNSKAHAIAYMPLVLSGILLVFQKRYIIGFLLTAIAMGLELVANHFQMTYYLMFLVIILGIAYLIDAYKKQMLPHYFKSIGVLVAAVALSIALNATNFLATSEYVKESKRSTSELTINPDGSPKEVTSGLDRDDQPIVEAPAYVGAVILFLFVFALFLVKGRLKWWLVGGTLFSLLLSYGKNLGFLTDFFIDYIPLYDKFRAVSSIQVILELCIPAMAIFGLVRLFNDFESKEDKLKALKFAAIIAGGMALVFLLFKSALFDFVGINDGFYRQNYGPDFVDALKADRKTIFTQDTIRTLILVVLISVM